MTDPIQRWLELKRLQLLITRQLETLKPVAEQLLNDHSHDAAAVALGLEITRPDATSYAWARDPELLRLQQEHERLGAAVRERQRQFKQDCLLGVRQLDIDFTPARRVTVQLRNPESRPGLRLPVVLDYGAATGGCSSSPVDAAAGSGVDVPRA